MFILTAGIDYNGNSQIVQIPASPQPGQTCFDVNIIDDTAVESDEEFLVNFQISAGSDALIGPVGSTCIQIIDDDEGRMSTELCTVGMYMVYIAQELYWAMIGLL